MNTNDYIQQGTQAYKKTNLALFTAGFITFANLYITQPLLPIFAKEFSVSPAAASLSLSLTTLSLAFGLLIFGSLSEAWGRKNMMSISIVIAAILTIVIAFAPTYELLLLLRIVQGFVFAGVPSIAMGLYISGNSIGGLMI